MPYIYIDFPFIMENVILILLILLHHTDDFFPKFCSVVCSVDIGKSYYLFQVKVKHLKSTFLLNKHQVALKIQRHIFSHCKRKGLCYD